MADGGGASPAREGGREEWLRVYDRMVAILRKSHRDVEALLADRTRLEAVLKIQHEFWLHRDAVLRDRLNETRRVLGDKELEVRRHRIYIEHQDGDLEDFKRDAAALAEENNELKIKLKEAESCAKLSELTTDHEHSGRDLRAEIRKLKKAYKALSSQKESEVSALLAEKDCVWNQYKTMENDYEALLKKKKMEAAQATEAAEKLQQKMEDKDLEVRRHRIYIEHQDGDLEDFKRDAAALAEENNELKIKLKEAESCAKLSEPTTDHEHSGRDLRAEIRKLKKAYKALSSQKESEVSVLLAENDFVWNQYKTMEKDYEALLKKKMEAAQATEAAEKLQQKVEELQMQVVAQNKDDDISRLQAEANDAKKKVQALEDKLQKMHSLVSEKDDEIQKLKSGHLQASQKRKKETTLNVLKFLSEYMGSSHFGVAGQEIFQKTGASFKQSASISIEKEKTHCKITSGTGVGVRTEIDEKIKKESNVIERIHPHSTDDIARSAAPSKDQPAEPSNKFTSPEPVIDSRLAAVQKNLHDATGFHAVTPECVITKIVEPNDRSAPALPIAKKVKARLCNQRDLSLLNTYPAGLKDRSSFFQYSVQHTEGTFVSHTGCTSTKDVIDCQKDNTVVNAAHAANKVSKSNNKLGTKQAPIPVVDLSPHPPASGTKRLSNVNIISPTSFGVRQSQLAKNADALYNNMLAAVVNRQHQTVTSAEDINDMPMKSTEHIIIDEIEQEPDTNSGAKDELIIIKEKQLLILPLEQNKRFPVSEADCRNYNTIIELAYTKGVQRSYALMFPRVHCNFVSLGQCLMPTGHMDNFLLPCICRKFFEDCHPTVSGRHHFFPHIGENILTYRSSNQLRMIAVSFLGAASASKRKRLDNSLRLFFPIVIQGHWIVFVVDFQYKLFAFLDSYYGKDSHFHTSIREKLIDNFINLWETIFQTKEHNFHIFKRVYPHVPKQDNGNDCGIFAVKFMEIWEPAMDMRKCFSQADVTHIRIQYMNQLYFWNKNSTDKRVVTDFNLEGDFVENPAQ